MKKLTILLIALSFIATPAFAKDVAPNGILNKFENFRECFAGIEKECNQFDYDNDNVVGFRDFGKFIQKFTKMVK